MTKTAVKTAESVEYSNPWFKVVAKDIRLGSDSAPQRYYMIQPSDYVVVLGVTPEHEAVLVRQYRPTVEGQTLEFPSGHVEPNENPADAAKRELFEETGYTA